MTRSATFDEALILAAADRALGIEARAVEVLRQRLGKTFVEACRLCLNCQGRVIVSGMGKSGHIGRKIAATFASTGTPAFFLHPAEASHGDLGMITRSDVVLALSNSGETPELVSLLPHIRRLAVPLVAVVGKAGSTLGLAANATLDTGVSEEACPLNLAPTASTTAALAMGDAMAIAMLEARGFTRYDFALSHPGGSLGRRLLLHVDDVMRAGDSVPRVSATSTLADGLVEMSRKGLGMVIVTDESGKLAGVFTDGDLRRALTGTLNAQSIFMKDVMKQGAKTIGARQLAVDAARLMEVHHITALPVVDEQGNLVGALNVHDLFRAGVV
jgi:arabinose-5-phosphate isomerase